MRSRPCQRWQVSTLRSTLTPSRDIKLTTQTISRSWSWPCTRKIVSFDLGLSPADAVQLGIGLIAILVLLGAFELLANLTTAAPPTAAHPTTALVTEPPRTTH
jgi:hypothetical protein